MRKIRPVLLAPLALVVAACASSQAADNAARPPAPPPATVEVATAVNVKVSPVHWVPGSVVSRDDARVASAASGRLLEVAEVGTRVAAGARLAKLDDVAIALRLTQARATRGRALAQRDLAAAQFARLEKLAPGNSVAATQLDESRAQRNSMAEDLAREEAHIKELEHELAETEIRAPFAGIVTERFAQRGEYLASGAAVVHLVDPEHLEARVKAPLALAPSLTAGSTITVRGPGGEQAVKVRVIVPIGDESTRQFELRTALPASFALVGSPIEAALADSGESSALAVPRDALVLRQDKTYVMRIKSDHTAERVEVSAGAAADALVAVRGALAVGDRVVVRGAERLEAGQAVKILNEG